MMKDIIAEIIKQNLPPETADWLQQMGAPQNTLANFNTAFITTPRRTGKAAIKITPEQQKTIETSRPGFTLEDWTIDRLCRVWLLSQLDTTDKEKYHTTIERLFLTAEMNELVALYSSLPLLAYPELWVKRCSEGIRSNIATVLEAIMYHNPYPAENLDEAAWNQMILKAFFTEKDVALITGLDERANKSLAYTLADYARERWAAHRTVNPALWRLVGKFIDDKIFNDIKIGLAGDDEMGKKAITEAIGRSNYQPAKDLIKEYSNITN